MNIASHILQRPVLVFSMLFGIASASFAETEAPVRLINFGGIEKLWEQATASKELQVQELAFINAVAFEKQVTLPASSDDEDETIDKGNAKPAVTNPGTATTVTLLDTISLGSSQRGKILRRSAFLELFLNHAEDFVLSPDLSVNSALDVGEQVYRLNQWKVSARVELSLIKMALAFDADQWTDKCRYLRQATYLVPFAISPVLDSQNPWRSLQSILSEKASVLGFGSQAGSVQKALIVCNDNRPLTKPEQEARAREIVRTYIDRQMQTTLAETGKLLEPIQEAYARMEVDTLTQVPSAEILALKRAITNALSSLKLVKQDMMMLTSVPPEFAGKQLSLLDQLKEVKPKEFMTSLQGDETNMNLLRKPVTSTQSQLRAILVDLDRLGVISDVNVKKNCKGLAAAFDSWDLARGVLPSALNQGLGNCLEAATKAFHARKDQTLSAEDVRQRQLFRDIIRLSHYVTTKK